MSVGGVELALPLFKKLFTINKLTRVVMWNVNTKLENAFGIGTRSNKDNTEPY